MGAFVVSALAADGEETTQTPKIVAHNVYYGDTFQIMYAIDNAEGATLSASCVVNGETKALNVVPFLDENGEQVMASYKGVEYPAYIVKEGFAAQAIDTVVTLTVSVDGEVVAAENYSVLQYTHERLEDLAAKTPANDEEATKIDNEIAMIEAFTVYAKYAEGFIDGETTISESVYVEVVDGTIDGVNNAGMFVIGSTPFANIEYSGEAYDSATHHVEWVVVVDDAAAKAYDSEEIKTVEITGDMTVTATVVENGGSSETPDEDDPVVDSGYSGRYYIATIRSSGNYFYMTNDLGTASTKRYTAVDSGRAELPASILGPDADKIFVLEKNEDGTYCIYAEGVEGNNYLGWSSGNSGIFVNKDNALNFTVELTEDNAYNIHFTGDEERYLALNSNSTANYFAFYKSGQKQDLVLIPVIDCNHTNTETVEEVPATCTSVGYTAGTKCADCGRIVEGVEEIPTIDHTEKTIPAVEATCGEAGATEGVMCSVCETVITKPETVPATGEHADEDSDGLCDVCGHEMGTPDAPAEPVTASKTIAELITSEGWTSSTTKQSFSLDDNVSVKINGGSNTGKAYDGDHIRIYATDSPAGSVTISVKEGYELVSIKITTQTGTFAFLYVDGTTTDICNKTVEVSGSSVLLNSVKNGSNGKQVRITAIEVVYQEVD